VPRRRGVGAASALAAMLLGAYQAAAAPAFVSSTAAAPTAPAAETTATDKIRDLSLTMRVTDADYDELKKIGGDFATSYRFKRMEVLYKSPNRTRLEAKVAGVAVTLVYNGGTKMVKAPFRKEIKDIANQPGQKQSLLHVGILARDFLATDYSATFLRNDGPLRVFKLSQRNTDNRSHEIVWVNPKTAIIERRQSFNGDNKLRMETRHKNAQQIRPGIWVPTRVEVYNQFGKLGGVQVLEDIKVNLGVEDDKFAVS
jgi:outer membrane lipoprotein-sorting protein